MFISALIVQSLEHNLLITTTFSSVHFFSPIDKRICHSGFFLHQISNFLIKNIYYVAVQMDGKDDNYHKMQLVTLNATKRKFCNCDYKCAGINFYRL